MVGKITSGKSVYGVLAYNQEKVDKKEAQLLAHNRMLEPPDGNLTIKSCMQSFEPYLVANRRTENPVIHISLNPHPDDNLSDEQMITIAQEYLEKLGYGDQPYVMFKHTDTGRNHFHIVSLRVDENGRKINDSWE